MSTQLLINGQLETFNQSVAFWQFIPQSQLRIDWGNGDIETIPGSGATTSQTTENIPLYSFELFIIYKNAAGNTLQISRINTLRSTSTSIAPFYSNCGGGAIQVFVSITGYRSVTGDVVCGTQTYGLFDSITGAGVYSFNTPFNYGLGSGAMVGIGGYAEFAFGGPRYVGQFYPNVVKTIVMSNTGATSYRWGNLPPQISTVTNGCILRVTFENSTAQDLSYPTCPTVEWAFDCPEACNIANRILTLLPQ